MQSFQIAILPAFSTASTETVNSQLVMSNNYLVYSVNGTGGGIVTPFNVKTYLDDPKNVSIATNFFNFLRLNTTSAQFRDVFYDVQKLSNTFNDYYNSVVVVNKIPTNNVISQEVYATSAFTYTNDTIFTDQNTRLKSSDINGLITTSVSYNTGQSYYINVIIGKSENMAYQDNFSAYTSNSLGNTGITSSITVFDYIDMSGSVIFDVKTADTITKQVLLNGFVDYNFDDNESEYWNNF